MTLNGEQDNAPPPAAGDGAVSVGAAAANSSPSAIPGTSGCSPVSASLASSPVSSEGSSFSSGIGSDCVSLSPSLSTVSSYTNGSTPSSDDIFRSGKHAARSLHKMCHFYTSRQLCDVTLVPGGQIGKPDDSSTRKFKAHRLVLSAASDYFAAMFTSGMTESHCSEVALPHIDADNLEILLHYCYTGELEVKETNVESLLSAAHQLLLSEVVKVCCDFLASQLHPSNCIGIQLFADAQGCDELLEVAQVFTAEHFSEVCSQQEFEQLRLDEVKRILSSDDLNVTSEETIMEAVMSWLQHDAPTRGLIAPDVLALVRLPLLSPKFISECVERCSLLRENMLCQQLVMEAFKYQLKVPLPLDASSDILQRCRPRKSTVGALYLVGGMDASKGKVDILHYNYRCNSWSSLPSSTSPSSSTHHSPSSHCRRMQCAGGVVNGKLHVIGGRDGLKTLNTVEQWDHTSGTWSTLPNMATHRHGLGVGVIGGVVYSVGGHDGWSYLNTVERWDPGARVWTYVAPMLFPRSSLRVAVLDGKLYAVGGRDGQACLNSVERYDPLTNRWSACTPMHRRRGGVGVAVLNGFLYAVGGHDQPPSNPHSKRLSCVERYDPTTDRWTLLSSTMLAACDSATVGQLGDMLVCVGGFDGSSYLTNVQAFDPNTEKWTELSPMPSGRAGSCMIVVKE